MVLTGFNTDFKFQGQVYHAQTEDNGVDNPVIVTLLYLKGAILSSIKTSYRDILDSEDFQATLMERMKSQHRDMMKSVLTGAFDAESGTEEAAPPPAPVEAAPPPAPLEAAPPPAPLEAAMPPAAEAAKPAAAPPGEVPASKEAKSLDDAILEFLTSVENAPSPGV